MGEIAVALSNLKSDTDSWADTADGLDSMSGTLAGLRLGELVFTGNDLSAAQAYEAVRAHTQQLASDGSAELNSTVGTLRQIHADYIESEEAAAAKYHSIWTFDG